MSYGLLAIRLALGLTVAAHGAQKVFGVFGGHGPRGTGGFFAALGFRAPVLMALAAVMLNAIGTVHWRNGFWTTNGGLEYNFVIWATAIGVAATGPGRFSLDRLIGWD